MHPYRSPHAGTPKVRDYDPARKDHITLAVYEGIILALKDEGGAVILPSGEVMDAMALLGGLLLAAHPDAKVPSRRRQLCTDWAKKQVAASIGHASPFDAVLSHPPKGMQ